MDKYEKLIKRNIKKVIPTLPGSNKLPELAISFDMFDSVTLNDLKDIGKITLYDQSTFNGTVLLPKELESRKRLLAFISLSPIKEVNLHLSDETIGVYSKLLQNFPKRYNIKYYLDVNRRPNNKIGLDKCNGELMLNEEDLMFEDDFNLKRVLSDEKYQNTKELKNIVEKISIAFMKSFDISKLSDLEKTMLVYNYIKKTISFANDCTYVDNRGVTQVKEDMKYCQDPVQTFKRGRGVCEGQARLGKAILHSPLFKVDCEVFDGYSGNTRHAWLGVVNEEKLYEVCFTHCVLLGKTGFRLLDDNDYPKLYEFDVVGDIDKKIMEKNIEKSYRRR